MYLTGNYDLVEKIISNNDVIKILNSTKLSGEGNLLAEVLKKSSDEELYKIYATPKDYDFNKDNLILLATVSRKKDSKGIKNWYIRLKGKWEVKN